MKHTIKLYRSHLPAPYGSWIAKHSDPRVEELFGSADLPTSFGAACDPDTVLVAVRRLNPNCDCCVV